jgi:hypothetical protein
MLKEEISGFADGAAVDEKDIAAVIGYVDGAAVFEDDHEDLFFLPLVEPQTLEIGTVEKKDNLIPVDQADVLLREKILAAVKKGRE